MNWLKQLFLGTAASQQQQPDPTDASVEQALHLTAEVRELIKERSESHHPFRRVLGDLIFRQPAVVDVALLADAYEVTQEARIWHGPNGGGIRQLRNKN